MPKAMIGKGEGEALSGDIKTGAWTPDEDAILATMQGKLGNRWSAVAQHIPGRTGQQCAQRWRHKVNPNIRKEKWTEEEDRQLESLVQEYGPRWAEIARRCEGRTDQQCMGRWRRHLDPNIRRDSWKTAEDTQLKRLHKQFGSQWSLISKQINGRTAQQCRARFFQILDPDQHSELPRTQHNRQSTSCGKPKSHKRKHSSELSDSDLDYDTKLAIPNKAQKQTARPSRKRTSRKDPKQSSPDGSHEDPSFAVSIDKCNKAEVDCNGASASSGEENSSLPLPFPSLDFVTPKKVQLADTGRTPSPAAHMNLPPLAALSPQQQLALSPFLAQWCSPLAGMSQRLSPSPMQESLAVQWRLSPTVLCSPGTQLPCTGGTPQLFSTGCLTPPTMGFTPKDKTRFGGDGEAAGHRSADRPPSGSPSFRGRLGESVKRKLSLASAATDAEDHQGTGPLAGGAACSTPPKRPQALVFPTSLPENKEAACCSTPVQLQQFAAHAGRPSLTPLSSLASMATDVATTSQRVSICSVNGDLDVMALAHARATAGNSAAAVPEPTPKPAEGQEGLMDKENSQPATAKIHLPRPAVLPKKQLVLSAGEAVAGSRLRLNALLGIE